MKLTKNEMRFNETKFPIINSIVEFIPVDIIHPFPHLITKKSKRTFIKPYMVSGTKCKVLSHTEHLSIIHFLNDKDKNNVDMVSNTCLVSRDLTDNAIDAMDFLQGKLNAKQSA